MSESRKLWIDCSYLSSDTLVVDGDQVELFEDGRAVRVEIDGEDYEESYVDSASYVSDSDQTEVTLMDEILTSGLEKCWVSAVKYSSIPYQVTPEYAEPTTRRAALSSDPDDPPEGESVEWLSDGTDSGDEGDLMTKINIGGTVKTVTLIDFSNH